MTRGARKLSKVVTKPEGADKGPIDFHAAIVTEITLLDHRFIDVAEKARPVLVKKAAKYMLTL